MSEQRAVIEGKTGHLTEKNMTRGMVFAVATATIIFAAGVASAVPVFTVSGFNTTTGSSNLSIAAHGDTIELSIFVTNSDADNIAILGALVFDTVGSFGSLIFLTGSSADSYFNTSLVLGVPTGGLGNFAGTDGGTSGGISQPRTISAADVLAGGQVTFFDGFDDVIGATGDGSNDFGVGGYTSAGNPHAILYFQVVGAGALVQIGVDDDNGFWFDLDQHTLRTSEVVNASIQVGTVPEPGTATLMGLGLIGMSTMGRPRKGPSSLSGLSCQNT